MDEYRDRPRPVMTDEEMIKDYPRLKREYALLHQDYREAIREQLRLGDVSNRRKLLIAMLEWGTKENMVQQDLNNTQIVDLYLSNL